jgi:hypothetical protein
MTRRSPNVGRTTIGRGSRTQHRQPPWPARKESARRLKKVRRRARNSTMWSNWWLPQDRTKPAPRQPFRPPVKPQGPQDVAAPRSVDSFDHFLTCRRLSLALPPPPVAPRGLASPALGTSSNGAQPDPHSSGHCSPHRQPDNAAIGLREEAFLLSPFLFPLSPFSSLRPRSGRPLPIRTRSRQCGEPERPTSKRTPIGRGRRRGDTCSSTVRGRGNCRGGHG